MAGPHLSLADLTSHDPRARAWSPGGRALFCCPLPECEGKTVTPAHRSLRVYPEGGWSCARCKAKGKLTDVWEDRPFTPEPRPRTTRDVARSAFALPPVKAQPVEQAPAVDTRRYDFAAEVENVGPLVGTSSAAYLESRGIPVDLATRCGVRHSETYGASCWWESPDGERKTNGKGAPAVVFPMRDGGRVLGMQGRATSRDFWKGTGKLTLKMYPGGELGAFFAPEALEGRAVVLTEAPIDALSLALCGAPTLATVGTACPVWLLDILTLRRVVLAHDADDAGDKAADTIAAELVRRGCMVERLRPEGGKDWNALLMAEGVEAMRKRPELSALAALFAPLEESGHEVEKPVPFSCPQDAPESASSLVCHSEHANPIQNATEGRVKPRHVKARQWPKVATPEYWALSLGDKRECCAYYDTQWGLELHHLLNCLAAEYDSKAERLADEKRVDELVALIEKAKAAEG